MVRTDELAFAQLSRQIKPLKGDYFRIAKDVALMAHEEELKKNMKIHAPGMAFPALLEDLSRLSEDPKCNDLEVTFLSNKLDESSQKIVNGGMHVAEIRAIGIHVFDDETRAVLKREYDKFPVLSILVLWTRYGAGKLGILQLRPMLQGEDDIPAVKCMREMAAPITTALAILRSFHPVGRFPKRKVNHKDNSEPATATKTESPTMGGV